MTITIDAEVPGLVVTRNGSVVGKAQWSTALPIDGGPYVIAATAPGMERWETTSHVATEGARVTVVVPALKAAPAATSQTQTLSSPSTPAATDSTATPPQSGGLGTRKIVALGVAGAGVVGVAIGSVFGLGAKSKLADSNANGHCVGDHCDGTGTQLRNDALSRASIATVAFVIGAAAIAGGAVLWFTAPKDQSPSVGVTGAPGAMFITGQF
jgi:hypothetical protein